MLNAFACTYDVRTGVQSQHGADPLRQVNYTYDATDQLKTESASGGLANTSYSNAFSYDSMGNRTFAENVKGGDTTVTQLTPNALNQISALSQSRNGATPVNSGFVYDAAGNTKQVENADGGKTLFDYDDADRLVRIETRGATDVPVTKSEFVYDYASRKAVSREFTWTNGAWSKTGETRRVFDGLDVVQERNAQNEVTAQLVRDGNIGGILSRSTVQGASFFGYDGSGNVTLLTDENSDEVGRYRYDAFGNTLEVSGARAAENPYRFSTKELHAASGLYDFGYRFYSAGLGRWINRDPIAEAGGVNLYAMVGNNPTNAADEYGWSVAPKWRPPLSTVPGSFPKPTGPLALPPAGDTGSWIGNQNIFNDWLTEAGPTNRYYGAYHFRTAQMKCTEGVQKMRDKFKKNKYKDLSGNEGSADAAKETAQHPGNATQALLGGYIWYAHNNGNGTVTYTLFNQLSMHSFFYHLPKVP